MHSKKKVRSDYGEVEIEIPRDRESDFEPQIIRRNQSNVAGIEDQIIAVSPTLISNITNRIVSLIKEWQNRPLQSVYAVVFLDAIHFKVKQDGAIGNKAAFMVIGNDLEGHKDVLGIWIGENESAKFWFYVLNELSNRGVQDILITSVDNFKGFTEAIGACYPKTEIQKWIIHQIHNSIKFVSYKYLKKITAALKPIYKAATEEAALEELAHLEK